MNGKENIINKILTDADEKCAKILAAAEETAVKIKLQAEAAAENERQALSSRTEALRAERIRNRVATAELDARKYKLSAKQNLIAQCYAKAKAHFENLSAKEKQAFVKDILVKYAEDGETVFVAKNDKDVITQKLLDSVGKKLVLGKSFHNESGGVILEGKGYEKDLTLPRIVADLRERTEGDVAKALFGE